MSVEGIYGKRLALFVLPYTWLQSHLHPSATYRQNNHNPTILLSVSTLSVGGKGLLATAGEKEGGGVKKDDSKKAWASSIMFSRRLYGVRIYMSKLLITVMSSNLFKSIILFCLIQIKTLRKSTTMANYCKCTKGI